MARHRGWALWLRVGGLVLGLALGLAGVAPAQRAAREAPSDPVAAEEAARRRGMERLLSLLEKNPRRGTALDRVYGYHVERGTLDDLIKSYRERITKDPKDGAACLILGLLEFQRGRMPRPSPRSARPRRPGPMTPSLRIISAMPWCWSASRIKRPRRWNGR